MNKKELVTVVIVLIFAAVAGGLVVAMPGNKESDTSADTAQHEHTDTSSKGAHQDHGSAPAPAGAEDLTSQAQVLIDIKDFVFTKPNIKIKKGTKVTWTNQDTTEHNVMREHDDSSHAHTAPTAEEVRPDVFAGPLLQKGESYSFTFSQVDTYPYHCAPHPYMQGSITVVE